LAKKVSSKSSSKEPKTMAELLASAESKVTGFKSRDRVVGTVLAKYPRLLTVDIGGKSEGIVAEKAFIEAKDFIDTLKVGDSIEAMVLIPENSEGNVVLSLRNAAQTASWSRLYDAQKKGEPVSVLGRSVNPAGISVEVEGLSGFIPTSQQGAALAKNPQEAIGKGFLAKVLEVDRASNKVVLSEKEVSEAGDIADAKEALAKVKEGEIYEGVVTTVTNFGCFVKLEIAGKKGKKAPLVEGLVHISELSWSKVAKASDIFKKGDKVKVKVIGAKEGRLAFSIKQAEADPWEKATQNYKLDSKVKGKVAKNTDFGVFVELEPGIEGLIHMTKIPPGTKLEVGQDVNVYVEGIDSKEKRLSLGLVLTKKPVGYK